MFVPPYPAPLGYRWIFVRWVTNPDTGEKVYPKRAKAFLILVPVE